MTIDNLSRYNAFLKNKIRLSEDAGVVCTYDDVNPKRKPVSWKSGEEYFNWWIKRK